MKNNLSFREVVNNFVQSKIRKKSGQSEKRVLLLSAALSSSFNTLNLFFSLLKI